MIKPYVVTLEIQYEIRSQERFVEAENEEEAKELAIRSFNKDEDEIANNIASVSAISVKEE